MTVPSAYPSPVELVPSELSAEFHRRVEAMLDHWQHLYSIAGVPGMCSKETERYIAEYRVGKEMGLL